MTSRSTISALSYTAWVTRWAKNGSRCDTKKIPTNPALKKVEQNAVEGLFTFQGV